jgi:hypothetical protein
MQEVLKKYPNVIYCYGHVHGADSYYAWYGSSELILNDGQRTRLENNAYKTEGYITAHMGSMAYYNTQFQSGWLGKEEPMINQNLMIDFYDDHITFKYYNHGVESAVDGVYDISSFTVMRDLRVQFGLNKGPTNWDEYFGDEDKDDSGSQGNAGSSGSQGGNTSPDAGNSGSNGGPSSALPDSGTGTDSAGTSDSGNEPTDSLTGTESGTDGGSEEDASSDETKKPSKTTDAEQKGEDSSLLIPLLAAGGAVAVAVGVTVILLLRKKRK